MSKKTNYFSRLISLLFYIAVLNSCNSKRQPINEEFSKQLDSLEFIIHLPVKKAVGFNIVDELGTSSYLRFNNTSKKDSVFKKKIAIIHKNQVIRYGASLFYTKGYKHFEHHYLLNNQTKQIAFDFIEGDILLKNDLKDLIVDSLYTSYNLLVKDIFNASDDNKLSIKNKLDKVYRSIQTAFFNDSVLLELNQLHYIDKLQRLYPNHESVDIFLKGLKSEPIACDITAFIAYLYIKNRINSFNFNELNNQNYSEQYISILSKGMYSFLRDEDNRGDKRYEHALQWLKTTDIYKSNTVVIDKELYTLDSIEFKVKLSKLPLINRNLIPITFNEVMMENQTKYYLIDLWATWCKPCLNGINKIKELKIPQNVSIINLSTDKSEDAEKWIRKSKQLNLKGGYLIDSKKKETKEFIKLIQLKTIPRYILIDNKMNLIDEAFAHPNHTNFLTDLNQRVKK